MFDFGLWFGERRLLMASWSLRAPCSVDFAARLTRLETPETTRPPPVAKRLRATPFFPSSWDLAEILAAVDLIPSPACLIPSLMPSLIDVAIGSKKDWRPWRLWRKECSRAWARLNFFPFSFEYRSWPGSFQVASRPYHTELFLVRVKVRSR